MEVTECKQGVDALSLEECKETRFVNITSSEGEVITLSMEEASVSEVLKIATEKETEDASVKLQHIDTETLQMVTGFIKEWRKAPFDTIPKPLDTQGVQRHVNEAYHRFCPEVPTPENQSMVFKLILASNYLQIDPLLQITCATVAQWLRRKNEKEIFEMFGVEAEPTKEQIEAIKQKFPRLIDAGKR